MTELSLIIAGIALTISLLRFAEHMQTRKTAPVKVTRKTARS